MAESNKTSNRSRLKGEISPAELLSKVKVPEKCTSTSENKSASNQHSQAQPVLYKRLNEEIS